MLIPRLPPGLNAALWVCIAVLLTVELALHSEAVIQRYRSVFAVGRAVDKVRYVESHIPTVLIVGNSRTDNGVDPKTVVATWPGVPATAFNLGIPAANAVVFHGIVERLAVAGRLGPGQIETVIVGLDESFVQSKDSLGYYSYLAHRPSLWDKGLYQAWWGSWARLWSSSANLRQLREPDKALRFAQATFRELEPVGGAAATHWGYRAGFTGGFQNREQIQRQMANEEDPPDPVVLDLFWQMIDTLQAHGVKVALVFTPFRDRLPLYLNQEAVAAQPYRALVAELRRRNVALLDLSLSDYGANDFIDPGHLNDRGAQRYSRALAVALRQAQWHGNP